MNFITEVTGVTFSDSDSAPVSKFLNPGPAIFQIWESDSCPDSGYNHQSNLNLPMFLLKKWPHTPAAAEIEKLLRVRFFPNFRLRIRVQKKTQNPAGLDSGSGPTSATYQLFQKVRYEITQIRGFLVVIFVSIRTKFRVDKVCTQPDMHWKALVVVTGLTGLVFPPPELRFELGVSSSRCFRYLAAAPK